MTFQFHCHDCGGTAFYEGPHGGDAVNFACKTCWARYNDLWPFSIDRHGTVPEREQHVFFGDYTPREPLWTPPVRVSRPPIVE